MRELWPAKSQSPSCAKPACQGISRQQSRPHSVLNYGKSDREKQRALIEQVEGVIDVIRRNVAGGVETPPDSLPQDFEQIVHSAATVLSVFGAVATAEFFGRYFSRSSTIFAVTAAETSSSNSFASAKRVTNHIRQLLANRGQLVRLVGNGPRFVRREPLEMLHNSAASIARDIQRFFGVWNCRQLCSARNRRTNSRSSCTLVCSSLMIRTPLGSARRSRAATTAAAGARDRGSAAITLCQMHEHFQHEQVGSRHYVPRLRVPRPRTSSSRTCRCNCIVWRAEILAEANSSARPAISGDRLPEPMIT